MDFLNGRKAVGVWSACLLSLILGCGREKENDVLLSLQSVVSRFHTVEEASRIISQWPSTALSGVEVVADSDIGGVVFQPGAKITADHALALNRLDNLIFIGAEYCSIDPDFFKTLTGTRVRILSLANSNVGDSSAESIASLPRIEVVVLYNTSMENEGVQLLKQAIGVKGVVMSPN